MSTAPAWLRSMSVRAIWIEQHARSLFDRLTGCTPLAHRTAYAAAYDWLWRRGYGEAFFPLVEAYLAAAQGAYARQPLLDAVARLEAEIEQEDRHAQVEPRRLCELWVIRGLCAGTDGEDAYWPTTVVRGLVELGQPWQDACDFIVVVHRSLTTTKLEIPIWT